ncbi:LysR family transcriptional regulator [Williamsia phyllosphaerae]|uniref:Transcriptional regulator, LysR family protein n=1 Tax=Williamsia phyllosphaerae TaxID=885042 RepID=A0ABQ1UIG3_9NOCA|nr:LysR family transcriptional regulator [Williamsia phyllosphaerae]GGF19866.1 putative transcriptional regulator, LysR family protein [Williamsia phyllosphaerae]
MEVRRLRILREFADRGSVGAVAGALQLTPSAVSQQLKVLARESGIDLLEQDGRGVRLTDAGRALVLRADEVIAAVDRAQDEMASRRGTSVGTVRVAMFPSATALVLPRLLTVMLDSGIEVVATDIDLTYPEAPDLLPDHDLVLTHRDERAPALASPRVTVEPLMREPIDVVVPPGHRLAGQIAVAVTDLADEDWISVRGGFPVDDVLLSLATVTGVQPRITHRINDFTAIEALVADGHGIALLPRFAVRNPEVVRLTLSGVRAARQYDLVHRPEALRRPAIRAVAQGLRDVVSTWSG